MDAGVIEVHAPDGRVWWVKRAWLPRYLTLRDRLARYFEGREPHWYEAPLRWFAQAGRRRWVDWPVPGDLSLGGPPDIGAIGGADVPPADPGLAPDAVAGGDFGRDAAMGGDFGPDAGAGGGELDLDPGDGDSFVYILLALLAGVVALALVWFVVLPLLLVVVDGVVLLLVVLLAGVVRLLFRRPWDVVAVHDRRDGVQLVRRWEVHGFRRAGRVRDDVARALETGTDPELAVVRVLVGEPDPWDPAGSARSR